MQYVIRRELVARSLDRLRRQKTHPLFAGYLCVQYEAARLGRLDNLQPDFKSFFQSFFSVADHPLGTPYIRPFTEQKASPSNLWLNANIAGSYAPSSLRPDQPFRKVVDVEGKSYSLPTNHASRALQHLLYAIPIQAADLATFLYRDYGLIGEPPMVTDLVGVFAYEFGYARDPGDPPNSDFLTLYSTTSTQSWDGSWVEEA